MPTVSATPRCLVVRCADAGVLAGISSGRFMPPSAATRQPKASAPWIFQQRCVPAAHADLRPSSPAGRSHTPHPVRSRSVATFTPHIGAACSERDAVRSRSTIPCIRTICHASSSHRRCAILERAAGIAHRVPSTRMPTNRPTPLRAVTQAPPRPAGSGTQHASSIGSLALCPLARGSAASNFLIRCQQQHDRPPRGDFLTQDRTHRRLEGEETAPPSCHRCRCP